MRRATHLLPLLLSSFAGIASAETPERARSSTVALELPQAPTSVEQLVVTGSRTQKRLFDTPVATDLVSRSEIIASGAENLGELLDAQPGVQLERSGSGTLVRLQGFNPEQVLILVDGERVAGRVRGGVDPTRFDLENVEQVEVVKGASSALYGSEAMGGVINIITRQSNDLFSADARATYGSFGTLDAVGGVGTRQERWSAQLSGGYHRSNGFDLDANDAITTGPGYDRYDVALHSTYEADEDTRIRLRANYRLNNLSAIDLVRPRAILDRRERIETVSIAGGPELKLDALSRLKVSLSHSRYRQQIVRAQRGGDGQLDTREDNRQEISQASVQYDRILFGQHLLTAGMDALEEQQTVEFLAGGRGVRTRGAVFAQDEWTVLEGDQRLILVPGLRYDSDSQFGDALSPKFTVRFDPIPDLVLRASYGWGFRAPTFEELYVVFTNVGSGYRIDGNPALEFERSQGVTVGAEYQALEELRVSVGGYYNSIENLIDTLRFADPLTAPCGPLNVMGRRDTQFCYDNVASAFTAGLETAVHLEPWRFLQVSLGYDLTETRDRKLDRPLRSRARHRATARAVFHHRALGTRVSVRGSWLSERPFFEDLDNDGALDVGAPYATLDVKATQKIFDVFEVFVGADNLLDAGDPILLPIAPRSIYGGIAVHYALEDPKRSPERDEIE